MKVRNMISKNGNRIVNQLIIEENGIRYFQSYNSIIIKIENGKVFLDSEKWDYSKITGKYRNLFLGETKKETERKIKDGIYTLTNLNP